MWCCWSGTLIRIHESESHCCVPYGRLTVSAERLKLTQESQGCCQSCLWAVWRRGRQTLGRIGRGRVCRGRVGGGGVLAAAWWDFFASPDPEHPAAATSGQAAAAAYWESLSAEKQRSSVITITLTLLPPSIYPYPRYKSGGGSVPSIYLICIHILNIYVL